MVVENGENALSVDAGTPPTAPIPSQRIDAFVHHAIINGHNGAGIELMLERSGQVKPDFLVKHPGWQTLACGL